ncbi:dynamin family protein [Pseudomonas chlororaphis]|uniref:dynamin family protein n=1 Tax=Pseudomonas chlororaphis TaxID=587753 RepID=UPI00046FFB99|nr:dynamin family protein [Pseudomonas chlororaphis]
MRANERFIDGIDEALKVDYQRSDQVTVVVYGSTQVGKTTLIISLLGIAEEHSAHVAKVLRGGQGVGQSSTPTVLRYHKSEDELWYVPSRVAEGLTDAQTVKCLERLRREVEQGRHASVDVLDIFIPRQFFSSEGVGQLDIRLLDLPGLHAENAVEREHVRRISSTYVPFADLIVLVGMADSLDFISPKKLMLEELKDWAIQPQRFRIVCTHSFSISSFNDWFVEKPRTALDLKAKLFAQFATHDFKVPPALEQYMYPIELGEWVKLSNEKPEHLLRAQEVVKELREALFQSIKQAANPYSRLMMVFDLHKVAEEKIHIHTAAYQSRMKGLNERIGALDESIGAYKGDIDEKKHIIQTLLEQAGNLSQDATGRVVSALTHIFPEPELQRPSAETATALIDMGESYIGKLRQQWGSYGFSVDPQLLEFCESLGPAPELSMFDSFFQKLNDYWLDDYFTSFSDDFSHDLHQLWSLMAEAHVSYVKQAMTIVISGLLEFQQRLHKQLERRATHVQAVCKHHDDLMFQRSQCVTERSKCQATHKSFLARMESSVQYARQFKAYMYEAHAAELDRLNTRFHQEKSPTMQLYWLALRELHIPEIEKLMSVRTL